MVQHTIAAVKHWWAPAGIVAYSSAVTPSTPSGISLVGFDDLAYSGSWSNSLTIPLPVGYASGDLLEVLVSTQYDPVEPNPNTPSGWTQKWDAGGDAGYRPRVAKFYKISDGNEGSSITITWSQSVRSHGVSIAWRGVDQSTPYDIGSPSDFVGSANPNPPGGTTVTDDCMAVAYVSGNKAGGTSVTISSGYTIAADQSADDRSLVLCYKQMGVAALEDPGAFTWNTDNSTAKTDYLRPAT